MLLVAGMNVFSQGQRCSKHQLVRNKLTLCTFANGLLDGVAAVKDLPFMNDVVKVLVVHPVIENALPSCRGLLGSSPCS